MRARKREVRKVTSALDVRFEGHDREIEIETPGIVDDEGRR